MEGFLLIVRTNRREPSCPRPFRNRPRALRAVGSCEQVVLTDESGEPTVRQRERSQLIDILAGVVGDISPAVGWLGGVRAEDDSVGLVGPADASSALDCRSGAKDVASLPT